MNFAARLPIRTRLPSVPLYGRIMTTDELAFVAQALKEKGCTSCSVPIFAREMAKRGVQIVTPAGQPVFDDVSQPGTEELTRQPRSYLPIAVPVAAVVLAGAAEYYLTHR